MTTHVKTTRIVSSIHVMDVPLVGAAYFGCVWDRDGERRFIPKAVLMNAEATHAAGLVLLEAGLIDQVPKLWGEIPWEACTPVIEPPTKISPKAKP